MAWYGLVHRAPENKGAFRIGSFGVHSANISGRMRRLSALLIAATLVAGIGVRASAASRRALVAPVPSTDVATAQAVGRLVAWADVRVRVMTYALLAAEHDPRLHARAQTLDQLETVLTGRRRAERLVRDARARVRQALRIALGVGALRDGWGAAYAQSPDSPVLGPSLLNAEQLAAYAARAHTRVRASVPLLELAQLYIDEGEREGVRGDVAFAQAILETGTFSSLVGANNFAGIGGCAACLPHDHFATARNGVRAQIQLLRFHADPTVQSLRDFAAQPATLPERFLRTGQHSPTWRTLGGVWSPEPLYGVRVYAIYLRMLASAAS